MVRFKVIKGSHLLLGIALILLALVIGGLVISHISNSGAESYSAQASLVSDRMDGANGEAEIDSVFASLNFSDSAISLDPEKEDLMTIELLPEADQSTTTPSVLIYHTHTHEAYEQVENDRYVAIEAWRTNDQDHSVVRVGQELANLLRMRGFDVVHDTTDHEQDELGTAYTRSLQTLEAYEQQFDLYIDLHRDAYVDGVDDEPIMVDGQKLAHLMLLIGNGEGFDIKPYYAENLSFAEHLTKRINQNVDGLCKDVLVKDGRYNQNIGIFSILVEVGHNKNTLQEALNSLPCMADALQSLMITEPVEELMQMQQSFHAKKN